MDSEGNDIVQQQNNRNYSGVKADVLRILDDEFATNRLKTEAFVGGGVIQTTSTTILEMVVTRFMLFEPYGIDV